MDMTDEEIIRDIREKVMGWHGNHQQFDPLTSDADTCAMMDRMAMFPWPDMRPGFSLILTNYKWLPNTDQRAWAADIGSGCEDEIMVRYETEEECGPARRRVVCLAALRAIESGV